LKAITVKLFSTCETGYVYTCVNREKEKNIKKNKKGGGKDYISDK